MRKLLNKLTKEEKQKILLEPGGKERVLNLNEGVIKNLNENIGNIKNEIHNVESIGASWISLTIALTIFQVLPLQNSQIKEFILSCLPSLIILIFSTALTLLRSPSNSKPDFVTLENRDIDMRLKISEVEVQALTEIHAFLQSNYKIKMFFKKFIGPSVLVNFTISIIFLILKSFYPNSLNISFSIMLEIVSIILIIILSWVLSKSKTIKHTIPLNP